MGSIRRMTPEDIEIVAQLDVLAFTAYSRQKGYNGPLPARSYENVLACLNLNPTGCFVAETDKTVGYIFTRTWGTTGWIGTFGVHPDCQGQGIGRSLLAAAVEHLQGASCTTIGLETMSDSPYNVGLYSRFGFLPTFPTVLLAKETGSLATAPPYASLSQLETGQALSAVTQISQAACPGLDLAPEASNAREYGWGETLLVGWPQPWALAIVRTTSKGEGLVASTADTSALVIRSKTAGDLVLVLRAVEAFVQSRGLEQVGLAVNTADGDALHQALNYGFRVDAVVVRMVFAGKFTPPLGRVLSKWLM